MNQMGTICRHLWLPKMPEITFVTLKSHCQTLAIWKQCIQWLACCAISASAEIYVCRHK